MVAAALEALLGGDPPPDAVEAALATIPAAELPAALRWLARQHGAAALPILRRCLAMRPEWASAAAEALGGLALPEAAAALDAVEAGAPSKAVRTAARRALYRLRQAGVTRPAPARLPPPRPRLGEAWMSVIDGTGTRGLWLTVEGPYGERTLLAAVLSDVAGVVDFSSGAVPKKRLDEQLRKLRAETALPWVEVPPSWAWALLAEAAARTVDRPVPAALGGWLARLGTPGPPAAPLDESLAAAAVAPGLLERSAALAETPELAGWFLDPTSLASEGLEWLQARESRLILSEPLKAERRAAIVDRVIETRFDPAARRRWQRRLEDEAYVLAALGRREPAALAAAVARALADPGQAPRHIPFVRALVERSLAPAGAGATGRHSPEEASRSPRARPGERAAGGG
jgi:hypothetical protein